MVGLPIAEPHLRADPASIAAVVLVVVLLIRQLLVLSDNHRLLHRLAHQAHHDPLTGLANRALFHDRLQCAMDAEEPRGTGVTVMSIDLDDFKGINDTMGHQRGDQLLTQAAARLVGRFRSTDTVAGMGGDEFTILIRETTDADELIARVRAAFAEPFNLSGCPIYVRPSIGTAALPVHGARMDPDQLLHLADQGMYADKTRHKNLNDQAGQVPAARANTY